MGLLDRLFRRRRRSAAGPSLFTASAPPRTATVEAPPAPGPVTAEAPPPPPPPAVEAPPPAPEPAAAEPPAGASAPAAAPEIGVRVHDDRLDRVGVPKQDLTPSQALALAQEGPDALRRRERPPDR